MHSIFYVKNVSKEFEKFKLENVSFEVQPGSIVGVIGKTRRPLKTAYRSSQ